MRNEKGAASLVIVTLTTILIAVLTVATTKLMTGELRQANDSESGIKAYFLAEGSSEEAIASIKQALAGGIDLDQINQNCDKDGVAALFGSYGALPTGLSCRKINTSTDFLSDQEIALGGVNHFDLSRNYFDRVELSWDKRDIPSLESDRQFNFSTDSNDASPVELNKVPAYMEVTRILYEDSDPGPATAVNPDSISVKSLILSPVYNSTPGAWVPNNIPGNCGTVSNPVINFDSCQGGQGGSVKVDCSNEAGKRCSATLNSFIPDTALNGAQKRVVMRIRPYYNNMIYDMGLYQGTNKVTFKLDAINIDITAFVGGSYRRILDSFDVTANPGPIEALWGDEEVCKSFLIKSNSPSGEAPNDEVQNRFGCQQAF